MDDKLIQLLAAINNLPAQHRDALHRLVTPAIEEARSQNPSNALVATQCASAFVQGFEAGATEVERRWHNATDAMNDARNSAICDARQFSRCVGRRFQGEITPPSEAGCLTADSALRDAINGRM